MAAKGNAVPDDVGLARPEVARDLRAVSRGRNVASDRRGRCDVVGAVGCRKVAVGPRVTRPI